MSFFYVIGSMRADERAEIRHLLETGYFKDITQLLAKLEWSYIYEHIGMAHRTVSRRSKDPGSFKMSELRALAKMIGVLPSVLYDLADKAIEKKGKK